MKTALIATLLTAGCASDDPPVPAGEHFHYVVDRVSLPVNNAQARTLGLDLSGDRTVDNQFGMVVGSLVNQGLEFQSSIDRAVATGGIAMLFDLQTADFRSAAGAGFEILPGDNPTPAPCDGQGDPICGHHLAGNGSFDVANAPRSPALVGTIVDGTFVAGPGTLTVQLALGGEETVAIELVGARVKLSGITAATIATGIVGGGLTQETIDNQLIPTFHAGAVAAIARDCPGATTPPCTCAASSRGETLLELLDSAPADCQLTLGEIADNENVKALLARDIALDGADVLSFGFGITAVRAAFEAP